MDGAKETAVASDGLTGQRARTAPQHEAVPGDAVSTASAAVKRGDAPAVTGGDVTTAGQGLLARR